MKKNKFINLNVLTFFALLIGLFSCETNDVVIHPDKNNKARLSGESVEASSIGLGQRFVVFVDGQLRQRNESFKTYSGQRLFVELRYEFVEQPGRYSNAADAVTWLYNTQELRLIRRWNPEFNNAYEFEVIAPPVSRDRPVRTYLSPITITHRSFDGTSPEEREPVTVTPYLDYVDPILPPPSW